MHLVEIADEVAVIDRPSASAARPAVEMAAKDGCLPPNAVLLKAQRRGDISFARRVIAVDPDQDVGDLLRMASLARWLPSAQSMKR
nr:hypothetical protein [Rhizorhabdus wittichii]